VRDDFYELGGHSLLLVGLTARLGEALAVDLPLRALTAARTVEELARLIGDHGAPNPEPASGPRLLVRIQPGAEGRAPLFCVHPISGDVQCYVDLARCLGEDQPVYGLQAADGELDSIEAMAARYLAEVRRARPEGSYRLAGWSLGGVIAFEMARQLRESGEEVDHLALLDAPVPGVTPLPPLDDEASLLTSFLTDFGAWNGRHLPIPPAELRERAGRDGARHLFEQAREAGLLPPGLDPDGLEHLYRIYRRNLRALAVYAPAPAPGTLLLLRARGSDDHAPGWQRLAGGGLYDQTIPGDHYTLMREPHVAVLGRRLRQWLDGWAPEPDRTAIR
jgi:thioesterase domain-containing protein